MTKKDETLEAADAIPMSTRNRLQRLLTASLFFAALLIGWLCVASYRQFHNGRATLAAIAAALLLFGAWILIMLLLKDARRTEEDHNNRAREREEAERAQIQGQLAQSQKMECVGLLAGGIAHDFNNILTIINGYSRFVLDGLDAGDSRRDDVLEIGAVSDRAARLTGQLLGFSRKQILNPRILDINIVMGNLTKMLRRIIAENITLRTRPATRPCLVKADAGQLDQVLLNLAINARDAMHGGGTLTFETCVVDMADEFPGVRRDFPGGLCVRVTVGDTGCGMTPEVLARLYEPFFTTKERGLGTGLGLSMVAGIVKQNGGGIDVDSAPGRGTVFRIYFPQAEEETPSQDEECDAKVAGGTETILVVEDDYAIRRLIERALDGVGYKVLSAANGPDALRMLELREAPVDLLITDVVMPGMDGRAFSRAAASQGVGRTLFISGFSDDALVRHGVLEPGVAFMHKPFFPDGLLRRARKVLDSPADQAKA